MTKFQRRLTQLGFPTYQAYLLGDHWQSFRKRYYAHKDTRKTCMVCDSFAIELHHLTYTRLGKERLTDVVPLCRMHHEAVHNFLNQTGKRLRFTKKVIRCLRGGTLPLD